MEKPTSDAILQRKTVKVLAPTDFPVTDTSSTLNTILQHAGMAPFHRACDEIHRGQSGMRGIEPWRFHVLDAANCRLLKQRIPLAGAGKIPSMLAAADALILATWLPNPASEKRAELFEPTLANMEHIAAASAAIQNLLLAATAQGTSNYWSSGGVLREPRVFELLGIPAREILLGAVFLFPSQTRDAEVVGSKLRERRGPMSDWTRWITVASDDDAFPAVSESPS